MARIIAKKVNCVLQLSLKMQTHRQVVVGVIPTPVRVSIYTKVGVKIPTIYSGIEIDLGLLILGVWAVSVYRDLQPSTMTIRVCGGVTDCLRDGVGVA